MGDSARILEGVGLTVRVERDREALVISPVGELDLANAKTLSGLEHSLPLVGMQ
jgi:hypothetical protein